MVSIYNGWVQTTIFTRSLHQTLHIQLNHNKYDALLSLLDNCRGDNLIYTILISVIFSIQKSPEAS